MNADQALVMIKEIKTKHSWLYIETPGPYIRTTYKALNELLKSQNADAYAWNVTALGCSIFVDVRRH